MDGDRDRSTGEIIMRRASSVFRGPIPVEKAESFVKTARFDRDRITFLRELKNANSLISLDMTYISRPFTSASRRD